MATYTYEAYDKNNKIVNGEYDALSPKEVMDYLNSRFLTGISIKPVDEIKKIKIFLLLNYLNI
jgi:type II secretory pathway component PulF